MPYRMDRYKEELPEEEFSRSSRNQELYKEIGTNPKYTNITDVTSANAIDLTSAKDRQETREGYQQMRALNPDLPTPKVKKELDDFNYLYQTRENRVYDINQVLEEAHKNRDKTEEEQEEKRKLKNDAYNITVSSDKEELEKYREEKQNRYIHPDEDELKTLINTISSKTLTTDLENLTNSNLFSDLMATNVMDQVPSLKSEPEEDAPNEALNKDDLAAIQEAIPELEKAAKEKESEQAKEKLTGADTEFYTKSMDLSDQDFDGDEFMKEKVMSPVLKIFLILLLLAALATAGYFIWKTFS